MAGKGKICYDHEGNKFNSIGEMCKYWNTAESTYRKKRRKGKSLKEIFTNDSNNGKPQPCVDHLGNEFKSLNEMLQVHGVSYTTYCKKLKEGKSLKEILDNHNNGKQQCTDPFGNIFESKSKMCVVYNVNISTFTVREKQGRNLLQSLDISMIIPPDCINFKNKNTKYNLTVDRRIYRDKDIFECRIHNEDGSDTFRIMTYDMIDEYCLEQYKKLHN